MDVVEHIDAEVTRALDAASCRAMTGRIDRRIAEIERELPLELRLLEPGGSATRAVDALYIDLGGEG